MIIYTTYPDTTGKRQRGTRQNYIIPGTETEQLHVRILHIMRTKNSPITFHNTTKCRAKKGAELHIITLHNIGTKRHQLGFIMLHNIGTKRD